MEETLHKDEVEILALNLPFLHLLLFFLLLLPPVLRGSAGVAFQRVALNPCYSRQHSSLMWSHVMPGRGGGGGEREEEEEEMKVGVSGEVEDRIDGEMGHKKKGCVVKREGGE